MSDHDPNSEPDGIARSHQTDWQDHLCLVKMDWLTMFAKQILPHGYWGHPKPSAPEQEHLYLTFDDGPHPDTTRALLDLLDQEQVKATFFVLGSRAQAYPELICEIARRGHCIGNHSFNHQFLPSLSTRGIEREIANTNESIKQATGNEPTLFRPPYGLIDSRASRMVQERNMKTVYWGAVSEDWLAIGDSRVIGRTMSRVKHGSLIVLHEGKRIAKQTLSATREIIKQSKRKGYRFKTIALE